MIYYKLLCILELLIEYPDVDREWLYDQYYTLFARNGSTEIQRERILNFKKLTDGE